MGKFNSPEELIEEIRNGKTILLVDDEDRENEGDLVCAADLITPEAVNFMAREGRGLICLALSPEQIDRLQLPQMVRDDLNDSPNKTAFTVSVEAAKGVTTGISAQDRAHTIRVATNPSAKSSDLIMPGHIFPIRAQKGGVLRRAGHTEGSVDLSTMAGLNPAAVICEVMNEDGSMARVPDLFNFASKFGIKIGTIVDLIEYRLLRETLVEEISSVELTTRFGKWKARIFKSRVDAAEHLVLQKGDLNEGQPVSVRIQLDTYLKDFFSMLSGDAPLLEKSLKLLSEEKNAVLLLLRGNHSKESLMQSLKNFTGEAKAPSMDLRDFGVGAQILRALGVHQIRLFSNKVDKRIGLRAFDIEIIEVVPISEK